MRGKHRHEPTSPLVRLGLGMRGRHKYVPHIPGAEVKVR